MAFSSPVTKFTGPVLCFWAWVFGVPKPVLYCSGPGFLILKKADLKLQGPGYSFLGDGYWCAKSGFLDFCGRVFLFWEPGFLFGKKIGRGGDRSGFFLISLSGLFFCGTRFLFFGGWWIAVS